MCLAKEVGERSALLFRARTQRLSEGCGSLFRGMSDRERHIFHKLTDEYRYSERSLRRMVVLVTNIASVPSTQA